MREELLDVLREPSTGARLELRDARSASGGIEEGSLVSVETGRAYPIVRGIPRFVDSSNYTASFGLQWNHFRSAQIDSETSGGGYSRSRFDAETGWTTEHLRGRRVLDAGCGAGRFAEIAASYGAQVLALDMSSAVDAAKKTLARFPNVDIVQGSILEPPVARESMDFAYCIGVAQHTPAPPLAVQKVVETVKPGGEFAFTIYGRRPWTKLNTKYLIRPLTKRLPKHVLLAAIERVMPVAYPVANRLFALPKIGRVAKFVIPVAVYQDRTGFSPEERYRESVLDTFDMLSPEFDSPMTWREVRSVFNDSKVCRYDFRTRIPINVTGVR
jgi:SAM-dependent methyltransferase